ncbi:hypothetical protein Tco_1163556 [Tanacetum coccineum]
MLAPKCATYNGRSTFANPKYLKMAQSDKPRLYEIPYDTSDPANRFCPDGEDTVTLKGEPILDQFERAKKLGRQCGENVYITNQCESKQALNVSAGTLLSTDQASVFMAMTSVHISSGLVLHQMTSDHNRSELGIQDHSNEQSSSKLVPKVVP